MDKKEVNKELELFKQKMVEYLNGAIVAEQAAMENCCNLNSEEYHKGIIYAFERVRYMVMY